MPYWLPRRRVPGALLRPEDCNRAEANPEYPDLRHDNRKSWPERCLPSHSESFETEFSLPATIPRPALRRPGYLLPKEFCTFAGSCRSILRKKKVECGPLS